MNPLFLVAVVILGRCIDPATSGAEGRHADITSACCQGFADGVFDQWMARLVVWRTDEIERTQIGQPKAPQKDDVLVREPACRNFVPMRLLSPMRHLLLIGTGFFGVQPASSFDKKATRAVPPNLMMDNGCASLSNADRPPARIWMERLPFELQEIVQF
jgi:hypothetical protein